MIDDKSAEYEGTPGDIIQSHFIIIVILTWFNVY